MQVVPKQGEWYTIQWKGESGSFRGSFHCMDRGFYIFYNGSEKIVCFPESVVLTQIEGQND